MAKMADSVNRCYNTLKDVTLLSNMDNSHMLSLIEQKMCVDDWKVWSRDLEKTNNQSPTLLGLMNWITVEIKSRIRATAPLRTGSSHHTIHHVNVTATDVGPAKSEHTGPMNVKRFWPSILRNASTSHKKTTSVSAV